MAGKLVYVSKDVSDGSDTTLTVTGINSDDVYVAFVKQIQTNNGNETINMRVTKSGSADTSSNYDRAYTNLSSISAVALRYYADGTGSRIFENVYDIKGGGQGFLYLYNFNSSSEYSFWSIELVSTVSNQIAGQVGGGMHTVGSASDGIQIYGTSGGTFKSGATLLLYRMVNE